MKVLTVFQKRCLQELEQTLSVVNRHLEARQLGGTQETYFQARVSSSSLEVWIYEDEAMFAGPGVDQRFEQPDYDSPAELISAFVHGLLKHVKAGSA
jgi:hypothetical protein